ncbi:hypothetical protein GCM10028862_13710 [Luteimonas pelagia]
MNDFNGYAVFFFPQAIEALGAAITPYLQGEEGGQYVLCREVDTGGPLIQLVMDGHTTSGQHVDLQLMFPTNMVRMIVSARGDQAFGFGPRTAVAPVTAAEPEIEEAPGPAHPAKKPADRPAKKVAEKGAKKGAKKATKKAAGGKGPKSAKPGSRSGHRAKKA